MSTVITSDVVPSATEKGADASNVASVNSLQRSALLDPIDAFVSRCGKRIRQAIVQLSFQLAGGQGTAPDCLSKSIEMLHAGSLVIDDIQDDSQLRRARPTMHRQIGVPLAINAGNWMYFEALHQLMVSELKPELQLQLVGQMVAAGKRCHEGQALDLSARVDSVRLGEFESVVIAISRQKTGELVSLATRFGATAAGADGPTTESLADFGMEIGVALQMRNDLSELLSLVSDPYQSLRSDDLRNARVTWPWAWVASGSDPRHVEKLAKQTGRSGDDPAALVVVAKELLGLIYSFGDRVIRDRIEQQLDRLHVVARSSSAIDSSAIEPLAAALRSISHPNASPFPQGAA